MNKTLLIDWNILVKSDNLIRFPVSIGLARELFGNSAGEWENKEFQEKYERKLNALFKNMRKSDIEFFAPGGSEFRRLLRMLWWFYIKRGNLPDRNSKSFIEYHEKYEDTYDLDPELFNYLYDEYFKYFKENYTFEVYDDIQRLIDRKPSDWDLGIFSDDLTKNELSMILDEFKSGRNYADIFNLRFGPSSTIVAFSDVSNVKDMVFSAESVARKVNKFKQSGSDVFLLYKSPTAIKYFNSEIKHTLLNKNDTVDRFDFDNPNILLETDDSYQATEESESEKTPGQEKTSKPKKIAYLHDIIINKFPFIQKTIGFVKSVSNSSFMGGALIVYLLLVAIVALILGWLELVDNYEDVIFYAAAVPFLLWLASISLLLAFMIITDVPVYIMNRYYENINSGLAATTAIWRAVYPFATGIILLVLYSYI
jgi:hypothetical protein